MSKKNLQDSFIEFCKKNNFEENNQQIKIINQLDNFINPKKNIFNYLFNSKKKLCFYLIGRAHV